MANGRTNGIVPDTFIIKPEESDLRWMEEIDLGVMINIESKKDETRRTISHA